jgi:hypothetical protein
MFAALRLADRLARPEVRTAADPAPVHALSLAAK